MFEALYNLHQGAAPLKLSRNNLTHHITGSSDLGSGQAVVNRINLPVRADHSGFPQNSKML